MVALEKISLDSPFLKMNVVGMSGFIEKLPVFSFSLHVPKREIRVYMVFYT